MTLVRMSHFRDRIDHLGKRFDLACRTDQRRDSQAFRIGDASKLRRTAGESGMAMASASSIITRDRGRTAEEGQLYKDGTRCPDCGADKIVNIRLTLHTDERLDFHSCSNCEYRWWVGGRESPAPVPLLDVLERATVPRRR